MKRCTSIIAVLILACPAVAQETPADWVRKLGSQNFADRDKAARALEQLGKPGLAALREAMNHADLETKRRAILIMERIEDRVFLEEILAATPVHLKFQDATLGDALHDVEKQIGLSSGVAADLGKRRISNVDTKLVPYWQAWGRFCTAAGLAENDLGRSATKLKRIRPEEAQDLALLVLELRQVEVFRPAPKAPAGLELTAAAPGLYASDDRHAVRVRVKWHGMTLLGDDKSPHAVFAVEVRPEPRLGRLVGPSVEITKIVDDAGKDRTVQPAKLYPPLERPDDVRYLAAYAGEFQHAGLLHLKGIAWDGPPRSLKELHGKIRMDVLVRPRLIEIANVFRSIGKEARAAQGITLKVLEVGTTDEGDVHVRLHLNNLESLAPTPDQQVVRVRPGVLAVRGVLDVALERLELVDGLNRPCKLVRSRYEQKPAGKGYDVDLYFADPGTKLEGLTLALTSVPRPLAVAMPFVVRDVDWKELKTQGGESLGFRGSFNCVD